MIQKEISIWVSLKKLADFSPFENVIWPSVKSPITKKEVSVALNQNRLHRHPVSPKSSRRVHAERIAFLVNHIDINPIVIDINSFWPVLDGNHRLAAAFYRGDRIIEVSPDGFLDDFEKYELGEKCNSEKVIKVGT